MEEESTEIEVIEVNTPSRVIGGMPYFEQYLMLADRISRTAMVPSNLRGKPDEVLAVVMYGAELGIGPMQALQQINFIAGKPSASAELLRALVLEAGHQFIVTITRETAVARCRRKDWEAWQETSFTMEDAMLAGLAGGSGWTKYPDQMLAARVTSKACRQWFADVISGMSYTPEEVYAFSGTEDVDPDLATEEDLEKVRTAIGMLEDADTVKLREQWKEAGIRGLDSGAMTRSQCLKAIDLIATLLNEAAHEEDDIQEGELISTEAASVLERSPEPLREGETRFA